MTLTGVISYPVPPYSNVPIEPQFYQPSRFVISAITRGQTTQITTSIDHNYVVGQAVRLLIPSLFGSYQLNEAQGLVLSIPSPVDVVVNINSVFADAFIPSPTNTSPSQPQILAIGDINSGIISTTGVVQTSTNVPGSFINISP